MASGVKGGKKCVILYTFTDIHVRGMTIPWSPVFPAFKSYQGVRNLLSLARNLQTLSRACGGLVQAGRPS